jgi:hypothetical protein
MDEPRLIIDWNVGRYFLRDFVFQFFEKYIAVLMTVSVEPIKAISVTFPRVHFYSVMLVGISRDADTFPERARRVVLAALSRLNIQRVYEEPYASASGLFDILNTSEGIGFAGITDQAKEFVVLELGSLTAEVSRASVLREGTSVKPTFRKPFATEAAQHIGGTTWRRVCGVCSLTSSSRPSGSVPAALQLGTRPEQGISRNKANG